MTQDRRPDPAHPGRAQPAEALVAALYEDLRRMAESYLRSERPGHTLQPTAIVHEAYLRLSKGMPDGFRDRVHFLAVASVTMRRVLVDHARARATARRGGDMRRITLVDQLLADDSRTIEILALDRALDKLETVDPVAVEVVRLRFFGGLSEDEVASYLGFSLRKAQKIWAFARAWLRREVAEGGPTA